MILYRRSAILMASLAWLLLAAPSLASAPEWRPGAEYFLMASDLPPSWTIGGPARTHAPHERRRKGPKARSGRSPWLPRAALGLGFNVPEIAPVEGWLFFGRYAALRLFYTPVLPFNIRVEMPSDVVSTKKGIGVANPDFVIRLKAYYGPHYGAELAVFPMGGSFYIFAGASHREMRLTGSAKSQILICSLIEVAKDPPCGNPAAALRPETQLGVTADARAEALLARGGLGFFWHVGPWAYVNLSLGVSKPRVVRPYVKVVTSLDSPAEGEEDQDITGALAEVKKEREADLERKALKEMRPVTEKTLPILGLTAGIRL